MAAQSIPSSSELALQRIRENITRHFRGEDASSLDLSNCGLRNIPGEARECNWVTRLDLSNNQGLSDIARLSWWPQLRMLNLSFSAVSNLRALSSLVGLEHLLCFHTKITDLSPLSGLRNLHTLKCYSTGVSDLSPLQHSFKLQVLNASDTKVSDLSPLRSFIESGSRRVTWEGVTDKDVFDFMDCPLINPPAEVVQQGNEAILRYWDELYKTETPNNRSRKQKRRYPGLRPFARDEASIYYGRSREVEEFSNAVIQERVCILYGKSGVGKTSLLQAGCAPIWENEHFMPIFIRLNQTGESLVQSVAEKLGSLQVNSTRQQISLLNLDKGTSLWKEVKMLQDPGNSQQRKPILIFDQFEELFTLHPLESNRNQLLRVLSDLLDGRFSDDFRKYVWDALSEGLMTSAQAKWWLEPLDVRIVFCLREDFLYHLDGFKSLLPQAGFQFELQSLTRENAREAIIEPALSSVEEFLSPAFYIQENALDQMLDVVFDEQNGLPTVQLQLLCNSLEENVISQKLPVGFIIQPEFYGGKEGLYKLLLLFYKSALDGLTETDQRIARNMIENGLISASRQRLSVVETELIETFNANPELLETLVERKILRKEFRLSELYYEISHDSLLRSIIESRNERFGNENLESRSLNERDQDAPSLAARLAPTSPKYILAIQSGSAEIWAQLALLTALEQRMARETERRDYRLSDTFDLIGGTGLANFVAMQLALGRKAFEIFEDFKNVIQSLDPTFPNDISQSLALLSNLYLDKKDVLSWKTCHYFIDITAKDQRSFLASWANSKIEMLGYIKYQLIEMAAIGRIEPCSADIILFNIATIDPNFLGWPLGESNLHILSLELPTQFIISEQELESIKQNSPKREYETALKRLSEWMYTGHQGQSPLGFAPANLLRLHWPSGYPMRYASSDWPSLHDAAQSIVMKTDLSAFVPKNTA